MNFPNALHAKTTIVVIYTDRTGPDRVGQGLSTGHWARMGSWALFPCYSLSFFLFNCYFPFNCIYLRNVRKIEKPRIIPEILDKYTYKPT